MQQNENLNDANTAIDEGSSSTFLIAAFRRLKINFCGAFLQESVFLWSLWWALGMCGNYQVRMNIKVGWGLS